jgi:hypothetical protein
VVKLNTVDQGLVPPLLVAFARQKYVVLGVRSEVSVLAETSDVLRPVRLRIVFVNDESVASWKP